MDNSTYVLEVIRTTPPSPGFEQILMYGALGLTGEAGEVADIIKKTLFHGHPLDKAKLILELGDTLWYLTRLAIELGTTLEAVMQANVDKLRLRYPEGFSVEASINRVDVIPK